MPTAWQSLEEAALTLGVSSRTLHRRIVKGECQTRLENGRREVLVSIEEPTLPDEADLSEVLSAASDASAPTAFDRNETLSDAPSDNTAELSDDVATTMLALHEDRIRRTDLAIMAYQQSVNLNASQVRKAQRQAKLAWSVAGGLAIASFVCAIWTTHAVTQANAQVSQLNAAVRQLSDTSASKTNEADKLRSDAETAKIAEARAQGQLDAAQARIDQLRQEQTALQSKVATQSTPILAAAVTVPATQPSTTQPLSSAR